MYVCIYNSIKNTNRRKDSDIRYLIIVKANREMQLW